MKEFPKKIADLFMSLDTQGSNGQKIEMLMDLDGFTREMLNNVAIFETSMCKLQWTSNQQIPNSFKLKLLSELLLEHGDKCLGRISDNLEVGFKKRRFELLLDHAVTSGERNMETIHEGENQIDEQTDQEEGEDLNIRQDSLGAQASFWSFNLKNCSWLMSGCLIPFIKKILGWILVVVPQQSKITS
ncbi:hypothetical protein LIER_37809 [Lithospermum erythrorhizon]|uniref:Uncharacterized protein n=1 Tax=Lithospermum erythrorhizon TaxID=34254 RepID=A0AAV3PS37_LITER